MKILVAVKRVPDPNAYLPLGSDGRFNLAGIRHVVNPWDEIALDIAKRLREEGAVEEIIALSVVSEPDARLWEDTLRAALARAADRALMVTVTDEETRPEAVAFRIVQGARQESPDLVLLGNQGADSDDGQTGARVAGILGWPVIAAISECSIDNGMVRAIRETDTGRESLEIRLPAVITCDLRGRDAPPIPLPAILKAKNKPLERIPSAPPPVPAGSVVFEYSPSPPRLACRMVAGIEELLVALAEKGSSGKSSYMGCPPTVPKVSWVVGINGGRIVGTEKEANALAWIAGRNGWPLIRGVTEAWEEKGAYRYRRSCHSGRFQEVVGVPPSRDHILILEGLDWRTENQKREAAALIEKYQIPAVKPGSIEPYGENRPDLKTARVVVAGGRGLRDAGTFDRIVGGLAEALGGAVAASGGASNTGIAPAHLVIGQSGKYVAPDLYVALGISGADQHVAGFKNAKTVVAINSDPDAPIFRFADIGLVADVNAAVPEWIARVRK